MTAPTLTRTGRTQPPTAEDREFAEQVRASLARHAPTYVAGGWCITHVFDDGLFELYRDGSSKVVAWGEVH